MYSPNHLLARHFVKFRLAILTVLAVNIPRNHFHFRDHGLAGRIVFVFGDRPVNFDVPAFEEGFVGILFAHCGRCIGSLQMGVPVFQG